jgi:hypothetical protein
LKETAICKNNGYLKRGRTLISKVFWKFASIILTHTGRAFYWVYLILAGKEELRKERIRNRESINEDRKKEEESERGKNRWVS